MKNLRTKNVALLALIALGLVALAYSYYVQYEVPRQEELAKQKLDEQRINELDQLGALFETAPAAAFLGEPNTIYISIPSTDPTCANLELPSTPDGWKYHCASPITYRNTDGTGWLPFGFANLQELPVDPINNAETLNYYAFVADASTTNLEYVLTATFDSKKYITEKAGKDRGNDLIRYEVGNDFKLWADANGLIGYWPFDDNFGNNVRDISGNNITGVIIGEPIWRKMGLRFTGESRVIFSPNSTVNLLGIPNSSYSIVFWVQNIENINQSLTEKWENSNTYPWALRIEGDYITFAIYDGQNWEAASAKFPITRKDEWTQLIAVKDSQNSQLRIYLNGVLFAKSEGELVERADVSNDDHFTVGSRNQRGDLSAYANISHVSLYNKAIGDIDAALLFAKMKRYFFENPDKD